MAIFYGSVSEAASLAGAGVVDADLTAAMQKQVNSWIENQILNGETFEEHSIVDEFHDIGSPFVGELLVKELLVNHYPVIEVLSLTDNARSNSPTLVNSSAYVLDRDGETGIIKLESKNVSGSDVITGFTRGVQSVKVTYDWGFSSVPAKIEELATLMLAKWGEFNEQQTISNGIKSIKAGSYQESYDLSFMSVNAKYEFNIKALTDELRAKYRNFV
jgi:hypothetical protein